MPHRRDECRGPSLFAGLDIRGKSDSRLRAIFEFLGEFRVGSEFGRAAENFFVSRRASVEKSENFCPNVEPCFLLYTSGSTGKPKGLVHTSAGYLLYAQMTVKHVFDLEPSDVFACVADIGWITGHTYVVYGPLANGATTLCFDSHPLYPNAGRYWETVAKYHVTQFYG